MRLLEQKKTNGNLGIIHFVGIGGIGMSGIAAVMHNLGYHVQGSDVSDNPNVSRLQNLGIKVFHSHALENIDGAKYIVTSSAIKATNPEVVAATAKGIPVIPRAEMLAELMRFKTCVAVSGSHGKTTTTSMIAHIFEVAGVHPTVINGGIINRKNTNAYTGSSDYLITEADESDKTFVRIPATIAVVTNINSEHLDFYGSFDALLETFRSFIANIPFYGFAVCCIDQPILHGLIKEVHNRQVITYGIDNDCANIQAFNINLDSFSSTFDVRISTAALGQIIIEKIHLAVPGKHNVLNALAAISIAVEMDFGVRVIQKAFSSFQGVKRRFSKVGQYKKITIIDDYAHHPEEIRTTIKTAKNIVQKEGGRLVVVCQPHRYSRVANLLTEFQTCFDLADEVYIAPIYSAGELNPTGLDHQQLARGIKNVDAFSIDSFDELPKIIKSLQGMCIVLMLGAGDITHHANNLEQILVK